MPLNFYLNSVMEIVGSGCVGYEFVGLNSLSQLSTLNQMDFKRSVPGRRVAEEPRLPDERQLKA
ncbi:hypothetical protein ACMFWY_11755 [Roseiconus sp. JC912]|uniref:hypothetical protein n=1 Tax=Roseiconus sp. JC912 TaxID=3396307 RepID=UPI003A4C6E54